jgi:methionyl-tRNA formyltransferase
VEFDAGPILCQEDIPLTALDNLETISCRSQMLSAKLLDKLLSNFEEAWRNAKPQGTGTWWKMPTWGDRTISWNSTVNEIDRVARAFGKFDSLATFAGKDWVVRDLSVWQEKHNFEPGSVVHRTNREVVVAASDGFACLRFYDIDPDWKKIDAEARM